MPQRGIRLPSEVFQPAYWAFCSPQTGVSHGNDLSHFLHGSSFDTGQLNLGDSPMKDEPLSSLLSSASRALYPYLLLALYPPIFSCSQLLWSIYVLFFAESPVQHDPGYEHLLSGTVTSTKHLIIVLIKAIHIRIELLVNTALSLASIA